MLNLQGELKAIEAIGTALEPLNGEERRRVLKYVFEHFGESHAEVPLIETGTAGSSGAASRVPAATGTTDIRTLKESKKPRNAYEMAALVAHYLSELAPADERKDTINSGDIEKYFKQAGFPLPSRTRDALKTSAGFLELTKRGEYRLTPVGHNLVIHKLPPSIPSGG